MWLSSAQLLSHVQLFVTPWTAAYQASLSITNSQSLLKLMSIESVMPSNHLILCCLLLLLPSIFPSISLSQRVCASWQVAKVLELQQQTFQWIFRADLLEDWLIFSLYSPRGIQESSPAPWFKSTNSLALSLFYGPTLISIHDYWKKHRFDYTDPCWLRDVSAFLYTA